ncbi:MAG: RNA polymerase factor sigma-54, partial [Campylobacter sp.]|nr:RNA polymerase factor sigma-54 [Campylobacter sp.]
MLRQTQKLAPKIKLNQTLRSWLPILQSSIDELKETLEPMLTQNPFVSVEQKFPQNPKKNFFKEINKNSVSDVLEATSIYKDSLFETLNKQINPPLFPTQKSQNLAYKIIQCLNNEGYFEYDNEILNAYEPEEVEKIRKRFAYLEPVGVGAKDYKESFLFQLDDMQVDPEIYECAKQIILNFENLQNLTKLKHYDQALAVIRKFKNPPAVQFLSEEPNVTPDIFIITKDNHISIKLNDEFYPDIVLDTFGQDETSEFISAKIREAQGLIDALEMRKATLYKIGLMIIDYQYDYFFGGDIKPMKLRQIAEDLGRNPSTISRAIANKYLECSRGTIALKSFFATALDEDSDISNAAIKEYLVNLIKNENKQKPLSDLKILELIQKDFNIKMVRRTITKYR